MVRFARSRSLALLAAGVLLVPSAPSHAAKKKAPPRGAPAAPAPLPARPRPVRIPGSAAPPIDLNAAIPVIPPDTVELPLAAKGAIVLESLTGRVLYEKNADEPQFPASTTKILTALLVIEEGDLDHVVEVTPDDAKVGESGLNIQPGQRYTRREALYGMMLKSANDVAHSLGRDNAGSIEAFAAKMTLRAKELGATNSNFMNPHGLHHPQHYTTPRDLACIARAAMQQPLFRKIVATQYATWGDGAYAPKELHNHNRMLWMFPGCIGVKTGYTIPSQQVLACSAQWGCDEAVSVIMHSDKPGIWNDTKLLLTYALGKVQSGE
ncbi:MAG TPA: D-alanyl-D-alanine carboxypeptidase family protein [Chthoniobacteraceae bacterium]|jgi:D-alanyl-D-alanine carboxypeptidase (penicillin-binding protein 5/6)|nr:D-alanyl-D-alanine carboxypeptidase family protein [Chthoniobacteraceae bacterium]